MMGRQGPRRCVLDVGGVHFATWRSTLVDAEPGSFFAALLRQEDVESEGTYFVDRDPTHFRHVLNWLRGCRTVPSDAPTLDELLEEAEFFGLTSMADSVRAARARLPKRAEAHAEHMRVLRNVVEELRKR